MFEPQHVDPQIDDEWEKMYLEIDVSEHFQDGNNNCINSSDSFEFLHQGNSKDINENINGKAYFEDLVDDQEDTIKMKNENCLTGRRIVDILYVFKQIQASGGHKNDCHFEDTILQREIKNGLSSIFVFQCGKCGITTRIETDPKKRTALGINRDAVLGITCVGLGFSHMEELCANLNVPPMSYSLFRKEEQVMHEDWFKLAKQESKKALIEEMELAKSQGQVDSKGNALIPVITDGSWGKRSYGRFFSSMSGCAVIIGLRTNKVVFFDVRNKYCHTCKLAELKGIPVKDHKCNKNYSGPSTGMESDIIIQGFKECDIVGARFNVLISDGDSNTYKLIRDTRVYKDPDVYVAKLECVNHLYRNFYKKFNSLSTVTRFDSNYRKIMITESMCSKILAAIRSATKHWQEADETLPTKARMLEKDILNVLAHYMGYHEHCAKYFCKKATQPGATNDISCLKNDGLFYEIQSILQTQFGNNTKSLLAGYTNNPAEQLNSYVAKYLGGKRVNYSLAGSYTARVAMAVVHFNSGCHTSSEFRKMKFRGVVDLPAVAELENKRKRKCDTTAVARVKKPRVRRMVTEQEGIGYGGNYSEDMEPHALEAAKNVIMEKLKRNQLHRISIEDMSKKDENFYKEKMMNMLMSYYFSQIVNCKGPKFYTKKLDEVLYVKSRLGNNAQNRHQRVQEQEALECFQRIFPEKHLRDCGLFIDDKLPFLGTSPFKLVGNDHILSVQCPLNLYQKEINDAKMQFWTKKSGQHAINKNSAWYIELQGELHITKKKWAYLMIWLGQSQNQHQLVEIKRDDEFFERKIEEKLVFFYNEAMLKELADSRKARKMELRGYDEQSNTFV